MNILLRRLLVVIVLLDFEIIEEGVDVFVVFIKLVGIVDFKCYMDMIFERC